VAIEPISLLSLEDSLSGRGGRLFRDVTPFFLGVVRIVATVMRTWTGC
jgi:hypothetical protein